MPPQIRPNTNINTKTSVTLSYTTLLSLLSALLTLKLYHAISTLTHGQKPDPTALQAIEQRIVTCFLRIIPQSVAYPSTLVGGVDGAITDADNILFHFQDRDNMCMSKSTAYPYLHSLPAPGIYSQKARTGTTRARTGTGTATRASTNSNTNSNSYGHPTINVNLDSNPSSKSPQIFHFSAFDLPSNQTRRGESSFVQTLATCAPYQRVGLRLVPGGGHAVSSSAGAGDAKLDPYMDEDGVYGCTPASVSASISESTPMSENTPKVTITDTNTDLEACLCDPGMARLANSFPGESPMFCAVRDDSSIGALGGREKAVYSVRPFSDLD